jgi:hypothetical protein
MKSSTISVLAAALLAAAAPAHAWEADTTHAGVTEQAALASGVAARLRAALGRRAGWLEPLAILPDRATALYKKLGAVEPTSGVVPDRRGRQSALAWLVAGAVLEGVPGDRERNHFYDPVHKTGLTGARTGGLFARAWRGIVGEPLPDEGLAAPDWVTARDNDLGVGRFWLELERAVTSPTRGERDEHLAMALICAGAIAHVLQDLGAPAHARDDLDEHLTPLGAGAGDRGSRFERLAALLHGRLGVPAPRPAPADKGRARLRDFFTAADGTGLADVTAARWYSLGTLPGEVVVPEDPARGEVAAAVARTQRFPSPKPVKELRLRDTGGPDGAALRNEDGVCLANYRVTDGRLRFTISDACAAEQIAAILPEVAGRTSALLDWLFRGTLEVRVVGGGAVASVPPGAVALGAGKLTLVGEEADGRRKPFATPELGVGAPVPDGVVRVFALFRGVDAAGEELVAVGSATVQ